MNVGVIKSDSTGVATLYVRNPQPYTVPWMGRLEPHVHFRVCSDNGMMGSINTVYMSSGNVEKFVNI
jgi:protocatechuate 3,4-dioxygenase beta subunit